VQLWLHLQEPHLGQGLIQSQPVSERCDRDEDIPAAAAG
jgi:hypothetical protein